MPSDTNLEKRREQNRRAQRKHRAKVQELIRLRRKGEGGCQKVEKGKGVDKDFTTFPNSDTKKNTNVDPTDLSNFIQSLLVSAMSPIQSSKICLPRFQLVQALYTNAERMGISTPILTNYWSISTIQLGWKNSLMNTNHSQNQIVDSIRSKDPLHQSSKTCLTVQDHESIKHWRFDRIPQNMFPTSAQLTIEHHPYIDCVFPWSSMRTKILLLMENVFTEEDLCNETLTSFEKYGEHAFTIWGDDPMDENSWEISETFAKNWWFLLDEKIINRTNWWRRQRDEKELTGISIVD